MRCLTTMICILLVFAARAPAQCGVVLQEETTIAGEVKSFRSHIVYDFDGPGPLPPELVVGADKGRVFAFNGTRWRQLGSPMIDPAANYSEPTDPGVFKLFMYRGALHAVAAGYISNSNGSVFRWDGANWIPLPHNSGCSGFGFTGWIAAVAVHNDEIIIAGQNMLCGGQNTTALAWNGTSWRRLGDAPFGSTSVFGAAISTSNGRLLLGGSITRTSNFESALIVELVNNVWVTRVTGYSGNNSIAVRGFQEIGGVVHALGSMEPVNIGAPSYVMRETVPGGGIFGSGWENVFPLDSTQRSSMDMAHELLDDGDRRFIAGGIAQTGVGSVVMFDAAGYHLLIPPTGTAPRFGGGIARYRDQYLALGGTTSGTSVCSNMPALFTAEVTAPTTWTAIPSLFSALSLGAAQPVGIVLPTASGTLAVQGDQSTTLGVLRATQCVVDATTTASRQGPTWQRPAEVLNGPARHLVSYNNDVLALGSFNLAGTRSITQGIARWDGAAWQSFPVPITPAGAQLTYGVIWNNSLVVADNRGTSLTVRRFDGASWSALGAAMTSSGTPTLAAVGPRLFVAFNHTVNEWNGAAWVRLGTDANTPQINRIATFGPDPVLAAFTGAFRWDGTTWAALGIWTPAATPQIRALAEFNGNLYAGLTFGMSSYSPVMRLDAGQWVRAFSYAPIRPNSGTPDVHIFDLAPSGDTLLIAGQFDLLGGFANESVGRYYMGPPRVLTPPVPANAVIGRTAYFSVEPEVYHDTAQTYRWSRGGAPLADGPTAWGSGIVGSGSPYLRIEHAAPQDAGQYSLTVTNGCGATIPAAAGLTLTCPADVDDGSGTGTPGGGVNIDDLMFFLTLLMNGDVRADVDDGTGTGAADGGVTIEDLLYYLRRYVAGC